MSVYRPSRIAAPEVLRQVSRPNLLRLLRPHAAHFAGIELPPSDVVDDEKYDFAPLSNALLDTGNPPPVPLAEALFFIHHTATEDGEEQVEKALEEAKCPIPSGPHTRADLSLLAWLHEPKILQSIYPVLRTADPRSAMTYPAAKPFAHAPDLSRVPAMEASLASWFEKRKRRCAGTRITVRKDEDGSHHFIIERPDAYVRVGLMGTRSPQEFGFPERFDLVIIRTDPAEMTVVARPKGVREKYRETFGDYLFGDPRLFAGKEKYRLNPLIDKGAPSLKPAAGTTLREVRLILVHYVFGPGESMTRRSQDIFAATVRPKNPVHLPSASIPHHAKFALHFEGDDPERPIYLEIEPPHTCRLSRHCDTDAVDAWLAAEGFIVNAD